MVLVLDRYFVHRLRMVAGKDGNPLKQVEMIADSLMNNEGVLRGNNVIKWIADDSVLKLRIGDSIRLTAAGFEHLSAAFFAPGDGAARRRTTSRGMRGDVATDDLLIRCLRHWPLPSVR